MAGADHTDQGRSDPGAAPEILSMRRTLPALAVTVSLLTSSPRAFESIWSLLSVFWGASAGTDEGCGWDPYGVCRPAPESQPDAGCGWDPNGSPCNPGS